MLLQLIRLKQLTRLKQVNAALGADEVGCLALLAGSTMLTVGFGRNCGFGRREPGN